MSAARWSNRDDSGSRAITRTQDRSGSVFHISRMERASFGTERTATWSRARMRDRRPNCGKVCWYASCCIGPVGGNDHGSGKVLSTERSQGTRVAQAGARQTVPGAAQDIDAPAGRDRRSPAADRSIHRLLRRDPSGSAGPRLNSIRRAGHARSGFGSPERGLRAAIDSGGVQARSEASPGGGPDRQPGGRTRRWAPRRAARPARRPACHRRVGPIRRRRLRHRRQASISVRRVIGGWRANAVDDAAVRPWWRANAVVGPGPAHPRWPGLNE
jgi:hypothetical protein